MKFYSLIILLVLSFLLIALSTNAQDDLNKVDDTESLKKRFTEMNAKINTIKSDFIQEQHISVMSEDIVSKGDFCFKKENKLVWSYSEPFDYKIVIDGVKMHIIDDEKTQEYDMESNKMFREINNMMIGMVRGTILDSKDFSFEYFENQKQYCVKLKPTLKEMSEFIKSINIFVSKINFSVDKIILSDGSGDFTKITFVDKVLNEPVADSKFLVK